MNRAAPARETPQRSVALGPLLPALRVICGIVSLLLFALTLVAGLYGTGDPLMNLAPTMVWIVWWVGLSLVIACTGNIWPALDPWRSVFGMIDAAARRLGRTHGIALGWRYPQCIGAWPAVILLLAIGWFEVVYPQAAVPYRLACALIGWSVFTLAGMLLLRPRRVAAQRRRIRNLLRNARPLRAARGRDPTRAAFTCALPAAAS